MAFGDPFRHDGHMPTPDPTAASKWEADVVTAQRIFSDKGAPVIQALYRAGGPITYGDLFESIDKAAGISASTFARQLLIFEDIGVVEALTNRPPGKRRGTAVLYQVRRERVDQLLESYMHWMRGGASKD